MYLSRVTHIQDIKLFRQACIIAFIIALISTLIVYFNDIVVANIPSYITGLYTLPIVLLFIGFLSTRMAQKYFGLAYTAMASLVMLS